MSQQNPQNSSGKAAILRAVFEQNRHPEAPPGVSANGATDTRQARITNSRGENILSLALLSLLLVTTGWGMRHFIGALEPASDTVQVAAAPLLETIGQSPLRLPNAPATQSADDYARLMNTPLANVLGLDAQTIIIDPGHGGYDPGTTGDSGLQEKHVTLAIAKQLQRRLQSYNKYRVLLTRTTDEKVTLKQRVAFANQNHGDLFISLHLNYLPQKQISLIETYFFGPHEDAATLRAAQRENQDSHYQISDFRPLIARIENEFKFQESRNLARSLHAALYRNMHELNAKQTDAGVKTGPFVVLLDTEMPSVLAELTCLSNEAEEEKLRSAEYRNQIAHFLEIGIVNYLERHESLNTNLAGAK